MSSNHTTDELMRVVENRIEILNHLQTGPADTRTLVDNLDISRSTINRGLRDLQTWDLIEFQNGEYSITYSGQLATQKFDHFRTCIDQINKLNPILKHLPMTEPTVPIEALASGTLVLADTARPYAPATHHSETLANANTVRLLRPFLGVTTLDVICEQAKPHEQSYEIIARPTIADELFTALETQQALRELQDSNALELFVSEAETPYFLGILDQQVQLGIENERGTPHALLETDNLDVYEWADEKYKEYRREADVLTDSLVHHN